MNAPSTVTTLLFTDIEQSSRLWEQAPERMASALARHDALSRDAVERHRGLMVKSTGDGIHAVFDDPRDAIGAALDLQQALAATPASDLRLRVRCGLHAGVVERRDNDYFGSAVNRAARIMSAAHGGQVLVSQAVADLVAGRLPDRTGLRDLGAARLRDLASPERLFQVTHPELQADFPPLRSLETLPNNLPQPTTSFIGRARELNEARALLARSRLLTLHGPGGIGKTRLSLQLAAEVLGDFPGGAWFVELASQGDAARVPLAVASVLGVKEEAGRPVVEALLRWLRDSRLLIVLDNCEHLIDACAQLAKDVLQAAPHVRIVATSREPLNVGGETTYPVPVLALPRAGDAVAVDAQARYEAVRLFVERAQAVAPNFALTPQNAPHVADICRQLDGIPLALELAAARVRTMTVDVLANRLSDRFRVLTQGDRAALPRQQTLRALIDWSHDLLSERERALLRRLAVFSQGWTLAALEAVAAGGDIDPADLLDLQSQLVDKSLVVMDAEGGRYRLLETVRRYAQERLDAAGETHATRARHLDHFLAFAEESRNHLSGASEGEWLSKLDAERENLLGAHAWCDVAGAQYAEAGLRLVSALKFYLFYRGLLGLAYAVTMAALARPGAQARDKTRCIALFGAGQFCYFMGRHDEAVALLEESLAIARELGDASRIAIALQPLGLACLGRGDMARAHEHLEEALALAQEQGDKRQLAAAQNQLGQLLRVEGALDEAQALYAQVLLLSRELGDGDNEAVALLNLAMVDIAQGATAAARARLLDVLAIARAIGMKPAGQSVLEVCAGMAALGGDHARAARFYGAAEAHASDSGIQRDPADEAFLAPLVARARDALSAAAFSAAENEGRALGYDAAIEEARAWLTGA